MVELVHVNIKITKSVFYFVLPSKNPLYSLKYASKSPTFCLLKPIYVTSHGSESEFLCNDKKQFIEFEEGFCFSPFGSF